MISRCAPGHTVEGAHSRLDYLVLNAGVGSGPAAEVWAANIVQPFLFTELLTPLPLW